MLIRRLVRAARICVLALFVPVFALAIAAAYKHAAYAAGLPQTPEQEASLKALIDALGYVITAVLATVGITGGLQQLFDGLPDIPLGRIVIKGGIWGSWLVGLGAALFAYASGRLDFALTGDAAVDIRNLWAIVSLAANYVYSTAYGTTNALKAALRGLRPA